MFRQDLLEPDHDPDMAALGVPVGPGTGGCQTGHQGLDQTLFNGAGDLGMRQYLGFCLGKARATFACVLAAQSRRKMPGELEGSPFRWEREGPSGEGPAIMFELRGVDRNTRQ